MKKFFLYAIALSLLISCARKPSEVSSPAADVLPDKVMFALVAENPQALVENIDRYLTEIPTLEKNVVANWIFGTIGNSGFAELRERFGITPSGTFCIFAAGMMPQSIGGAFTISDRDVFLDEFSDFIRESEPIGDLEVSVSTIPNMGQIFFCSSNDLLLFAGSRTLLESMMDNLDGEVPDFVPAVPPASVYCFLDIGSVGPMFAMQLSSFKPMIIEDISKSPGMAVNPEQMYTFIDMYFDLFNIILTETENADLLLTFGESDITGEISAVFVSGSTLDSLIVPVQPGDFTHLVPAGNVVEGRFSIAEETTAALMTATINSFGIEPAPFGMVEFWAACTRNMAMTMITTPDNPIQIIGVYDLPDGAVLSDVKAAYDDQMQMSAEFLSAESGMEWTTPAIQSYADMDWVTFAMNMTTPEEYRMTDSAHSYNMDFNWTVWLTIYDGLMYMEMAETPDILVTTFNGGASSPVLLEGFNPDAEMAVRLNIPGYAEMTAAMIDSGYVDTDFEPVWLDVEVDFVDGGVNKMFSVSGIELCRFIGNAMDKFSEN